MQFAVTFRHMEPTEALKAYARERMERVRKYLPDPISCHVVLSTERHNHRIDVTAEMRRGGGTPPSRSQASSPPASTPFRLHPSPQAATPRNTTCCSGLLQSVRAANRATTRV